VTVKNGIAILPNITGLAGGEHIVNVTYNGDSRYSPKDKNGTVLKVEPTPDWKMTITVDEHPYGENTTIHITSLPYHLAGKNVTITIDETSYVVNLTNGNATLTLNNLSAGLHSASVSYVGDANYTEKHNFSVCKSKKRLQL
jgi:hypothetical protein